MYAIRRTMLSAQLAAMKSNIIRSPIVRTLSQSYRMWSTNTHEQLVQRPQPVVEERTQPSQHQHFTQNQSNVSLIYTQMYIFRESD